jgi:hypothetical protein
MNGWRAQARLIWFMSRKNPSNIKTALILASIALIFFIGVFARRLWLS